MILYVLLIFILTIIVFLGYVKIKYQFWALQPVYHYYDILYWFYDKGIIREELPQKTKYTNLKEIKTYDLDHLTNKKLLLKEAITLIQYNYLYNKKSSVYFPKEKNVIPYFEGHSNKCFWTFIQKPETFMNTSNGKLIENKLLVGLITSRPLHIKINPKYNKQPINFDLYYVDYLCVKKEYRKKGIAPQLIQTHEYNQSYNNKRISVSLFKREDVNFNGIVSLTKYNSYAFNMFKWIKIPYLSESYKIIDADKQNIYYLYNFLNEMYSIWDIVIWPEISNLVGLIESKNIIIKMILLDTEIQAIYFFKKTCTKLTNINKFNELNKSNEILDLYASINRFLSKENFINAFKVGLQEIRQKNVNYGYLMVEDISHNNIIINNLLTKTHPLVISPTAYFFYNFAYHTIQSNKCLIIN